MKTSSSTTKILIVLFLISGCEQTMLTPERFNVDVEIICNNFDENKLPIDDDSDGAANCNDPDCSGRPECQPQIAKCPNDELDPGEACDGDKFLVSDKCIDEVPSIASSGLLTCNSNCTLNFDDCMSSRIVPPSGGGGGSNPTPLPQLFPERLCFDGQDNNKNGDSDGNDDDCRRVMYPDQKPVYGPENTDYSCSDGINNNKDKDNLIDCNDPSCASIPPCLLNSEGNPVENCVNGVDDDANGAMDCNDSTCLPHPMCNLTPKRELNCFDNIDNDNDKDIDCADSDCINLIVNNKYPSSICAPENTQDLCNDGFNNDGILGTDCQDTQCVIARGNCQQCNDLNASVVCNDNKDCTNDICVNNLCVHETITDTPCCAVDTDCIGDNGNGDNNCNDIECDPVSRLCIVDPVKDHTPCPPYANLCKPHQCINGKCEEQPIDPGYCLQQINSTCEDAQCQPGVTGSDPVSGCMITSKIGVENCCSNELDCKPNTLCRQLNCNEDTHACQEEFTNDGELCNIFPTAYPGIKDPEPTDPSFPFYPLCQPGRCNQGTCVQDSQPLADANNPCIPKYDCDKTICSLSDDRRDKVTGCLTQLDDTVCSTIPDPLEQCFVCNPTSTNIVSGNSGCAPCDDAKACTEEQCSSNQLEKCEHTPNNEICATLMPECKAPSYQCDPSNPLSDKEGCVYCNDNKSATTDFCDPLLGDSSEFGGCRNSLANSIGGAPGILLCVNNSSSPQCSGTSICGDGNSTVGACAGKAVSSLTRTDRLTSLTFFASRMDLPATYSLVINWGDSTETREDPHTKPQPMTFTHVYSSAGKFDITISLGISSLGTSTLTIPIIKNTQAPSSPGANCALNEDCQSLNCFNNICGSLNASCKASSDCADGRECNGGKCIPKNCQDKGKCIMFVTSTYTNGNIVSGGKSGLAGADAECNRLAGINSPSFCGAPGQIRCNFQAWLCGDPTSGGSSTLSSPALRSTHSNVPYVTTQGVGNVIANNWQDLTDGTLRQAIQYNESARVETGRPVWSGVASDGTCQKDQYTCSFWQSGAAGRFGGKGDQSSTSSKWTDDATNNCARENRFYCIEQ